VCVNGLGLTLHNVNPIMKFILYHEKQCKIKCIYRILHGSIKQCKCKNKYIYMILHGYVKQYNNKKKCDFNLKRGDFNMFLKIIQLNGALIAKKKKPS
jgi:hypothetical protein